MLVNCIRIRWPRARRCSLAGWTHCAFCEGVTEVVKCHGQECTGGMGRVRSFVLSFFFYFYSIGAPWYTIHHGWEALWYVTDMNIIPPLFPNPRSCRRHFAAATRNAIRIPLSWSCASYNVIVADTMMVVNTFQTRMASDMLHDNHSILRPSRECMCNGWGQIIILLCV